jgi:hypothetical protein
VMSRVDREPVFKHHARHILNGGPGRCRAPQVWSNAVDLNQRRSARDRMGCIK